MGRKAIDPEVKKARKDAYNKTYYQSKPEHWTNIKGEHGERLKRRGLWVFAEVETKAEKTDVASPI